MPAPTHTIRKPKGKGRAAAPEKVTPTMPLGKQLAHTGQSAFDVTTPTPADEKQIKQ